jgi:hypothetical protein
VPHLGAPTMKKSGFLFTTIAFPVWAEGLSFCYYGRG